MVDKKSPGKKVKVKIIDLAGEETREISEAELKKIKGGAAGCEFAGKECQKLEIIVILRARKWLKIYLDNLPH